MGIRNLTEDISIYSNSVVAVSLNETLTWRRVATGAQGGSVGPAVSSAHWSDFTLHTNL